MRFTLSIILCLLFCRTFSQSPGVEGLLTKPIVNCETVYNNALEVIPQIYASNSIDSVVRAIGFWESVCGVTEPGQRMKILVAIRNRNFSELLYDSNIVRYIQSYRYLVRYLASSGDHYELGRIDAERLKSFNAFTESLALSLMEVADTSSLEYFFCRLYANQTGMDEYPDHPKFSNSRLARFRENHTTRLKRVSRSHVSITAGIWMPTGNASLLGNHPELGFQLGFKKLKNRFDFGLAFRFIHSANNYQILRNGQLFNSKHFLGGLAGLEYAREFHSRKNHFIEVIGGFGADGFDVWNSDKDDAEIMKPLSIWSFNVNGGFQYNLMMKPTTYLSFRTQYHFMKYNNKGGTSLSGNAITAGLVLGFYSHPL
jgi:hypothetical protein